MKLGKCSNLNSGSTLPEKERRCFAKLWGPAVPEASTNSLSYQHFKVICKFQREERGRFVSILLNFFELYFSYMQKK